MQPEFYTIIAGSINYKNGVKSSIMENKVYTISITAPSGGGKTTITNLLKNKLENSFVLNFDDYDFINDPGDDQFNEELIQYDYNKWELMPLKNDIEKILLENKYKYLLLDYPFSYCNNKIKKYIDFSIYIDTPLDIAMARRIIRDYDQNKNIKNEMEIYLKYGRIGYTDMEKFVKPTCNLIVNGNNEPEKIVGIIIENIKKCTK
jgi:uridine kinase